MSRRGPRRAMAAVATVATVAIFWAFFAPTKLGGSTTYSVTAGISMNPLLYRGDLAAVRPQSSYHVGDVVLYNSPVLHRPVLHRIIQIQHGDYFFKGDNNSFVDPGYATRAELVGKLWFHLPTVGGALSWVGAPRHAALIAGAAVLFVSVIARRGQEPRRRKRRVATRRQNALPRS